MQHQTQNSLFRKWYIYIVGQTPNSEGLRGTDFQISEPETYRLTYSYQQFFVLFQVRSTVCSSGHLTTASPSTFWIKTKITRNGSTSNSASSRTRVQRMNHSLADPSSKRTLASEEQSSLNTRKSRPETTARTIRSSSRYLLIVTD